MRVYKENILFEQFSKILNLKNDLIYSVPWIQPVKIDDKLIKDYSFIYKFNILNFLFNFLKSVYEVFICLNKLIISIFIKEKKKNIDSNILILSHLISSKHLNSKNDFYFGNLEDNLNKVGHKTNKYFLNHTNLNKNMISNSKFQVLPKIDNFKIEFEVFFNQIKLFIFFLSNLFLLIKKNQKLSIILIFILKIFSYHTQSALRIGIQLKSMTKNKKVKYLFITFEGHSYEKMISLYNKDTSIIAYQNTPLSICQYSIKFYSNNTLPKILLAKNEIYKKFLEKNLKLNTKILNFGDLNYKEITNSMSYKKRVSSILFVPEGINNEVNTMIDFIKRNYKANPNVYFTIRFHPVFPKQLINKYKSLFYDASNVFFSDNTPNEDFSNNTYVIFRGSSITFDAIRAGLIPIYLNKGTNINILDLFELFNYGINFDSKLNITHLKNLTLDSDAADKFTNLFYPAKFERLLNEIS